jgi:signal peptidase I
VRPAQARPQAQPQQRPRPHYNDPWDVPEERGRRAPAPRPRPQPRPAGAPRLRRDPATYEGTTTATGPIQQYRTYIEYGAYIAVAVIIALFIRTFVVQPFFIPSESMFPLLTDDDRILVNKVAYKVGDVHRGDVVVFKAPPKEKENNPDIDNLVKRVIALPGDTVEGINGDLYVNGVKQDEPYLAPGATTEDLPKTVIPAGDFWAMGDNRNNSSDSRDFGAVDEGLIIGRVDVLIWPIPHIKHISR